MSAKPPLGPRLGFLWFSIEVSRMGTMIDSWIRTGLQLIHCSFTNLSALWQDARKTNNVEKMSEFLDAVRERCHLFQAICRCIPKGSIQETKHLDQVIQAVEECCNLPSETDTGKLGFVAKADESLSRLRSQIQG